MYRKIFGVILLVLTIIPAAGLCQISPQTIDKCLEATVVIEAHHDNEIHLGSGFLWKDTTHVITAWHVVAGAKTIFVQTRYDDKSIGRHADLTAISEEADLARLEFDTPFGGGSAGQRQPLQERTDNFQVNEKLWAFGAPLGVLTPDHTSVETKSDNNGIKALKNWLNESARESISKLGIPSVNLPVLNLGGDLMLGHSGCAIVNYQGKVVGIGNGGLGVGRIWAIPAKHLDDLKSVQDGEGEGLWVKVGELYSFSKAFKETPLPLMARFDASELSGVAPMDIAFFDRSQGSPTEWLWKFGDGKLDDKKNPIHSYTKPTYSYDTTGACWNRKPLTVTLTVRNEKGEEHTSSLLDAIDLKPKQVQLKLQVLPSKLSGVVYAQQLPPNSRGCGTISLAIISTPPGHYYIGQEVGLQVAPQVKIIENGQQVTYVFDRWSGWLLDEERVLANGSQWARLRITNEMPDGITIMAHYKKQP